MIDTQHIDMDVMPVNILFPAALLTDSLKDLLSSKDLMAAPECLDFRKYMIQGLYAQRHGVGIINDPGLRRIFFYGPGNLHKHGYGAQGTDHSARPCRIAYRLVDSQALRKVNIRLHLVKGAGQDGNDNEIAACQGVLKTGAGLKLPVSFGFVPLHKPAADYLIVLCRVTVNIIQTYGTADLVFQGKVCHKGPGPSPGTAAYICNLNILNFIITILHSFLLNMFT